MSDHKRIEYLKKLSDKPLKKHDDQSRRDFIRRAGIFMGAFGVPWFQRMDVMEKISKKIFGSSLAFAQGGAAAPSISLNFRMGYPSHNLFCAANDANAASTGARRNIHFDPTMTIAVPSTTGGRTLYGSPQMATLLASPYASRIAMISSVESMGGHTNEFVSTHAAGAGNLFNVIAEKNAASALAPLLPVLSFGDRSRVSFDRLSATQSADLTPIYLKSNNEVDALFKPLELKDTNGKILSPNLASKINNILYEDIDGVFLKAIAGRPGAKGIGASLKKQQELLTYKLAASVTPTQELIDAMKAGVTAPNMMALDTVFPNGADDAIARFFVSAGLLIANGVSLTLGCDIDTGDWHQQSTPHASGNAGDGTAQGQHASFWNAMLLNVMNEYTNNPAYTMSNGDKLGDKINIVGDSEFSRTVFVSENADNGDGENLSAFYIGPNTKGGTFGNVNNSGQGIGCNPATGEDASTPGFLESKYMYNTLAALHGIDLSTTGISRADQDKIITAAIK